MSQTGLVPRSERAPGYVIEPATPGRDETHLALACREVVGFDEARVAADDPTAEAPTRVTLVGLADDAADWVARWAEDVDHVRRRITIRRVDGAEVTVVATLATFGPNVPTSLAVESVRVPRVRAILRSGVHPRAEVEAALGLRLPTGHDDGSALPPL